MPETTQHRENKMGVLPIGKLLLNISLPIILSMTVQALYNIVDSMFVSRISEEALTAVSLVFPMQSLIIAISAGTAVGFNALVSRALGAHEYHRANQIAQHSIFLTFLSVAVVAAVMWIISDPFITLQTTDPAIRDGAILYMRICCVLCIGIFFSITFERLLMSTGKTVYTMIGQMTGAIINIVMDPVLIFGIGPFPEMGIAGAAAATVLGQCIAALLDLSFNIRVNKEISLSMRGFRPEKAVIKEIYEIGVPSIIVQSIGSVMVFGMNMILMQFLGNATAAAVFGVYFKLNSIFFMPVFGLNNGLVPIIAYNYGAGHRHRIVHAKRLGTLVAVVVMAVGMAIFWLFPKDLLAIFNASDRMQSIGVPALRIIALSFPFAGYCISVSSAMQALGSAFYSMINSLTRQLIVLLPSAFVLAWLFRAQGGLPMLWFSFLIAEGVSVAMITAFYAKVYHQKVASLSE
jgi:putative MATE family efflux protein